MTPPRSIPVGPKVTVTTPDGQIVAVPLTPTGPMAEDELADCMRRAAWLIARAMVAMQNPN